MWLEGQTGGAPVWAFASVPWPRGGPGGPRWYVQDTADVRSKARTVNICHALLSVKSAAPSGHTINHLG